MTLGSHPNHEWRAPVNRVYRGLRCPLCTHRKPSPQCNAKLVAPHLEAEWHPTKNGSLTLSDMLPAGRKKVWWQCAVDSSHEWEAIISNRVKGTSCPFCWGHFPSQSNSLASLAPQVAAQWHPTKNGTLTPHDVTAMSGKRVWWKCPHGSDHEWQTAINNRVSGSQCPMCLGRRVSRINALERDLPRPEARWHPTLNGELTPADISYGSRTPVYWQCPVDPQHVWKSPPRWMSGGKGKCPFCLGRRTDASNSLASRMPEVASDWDGERNGTLTPHEVTVSSNLRAWWKCSRCGHGWQGTVNNQTHLKTTRCPECRRRGQVVKPLCPTRLG